jgi:hypothetical protein
MYINYLVFLAMPEESSALPCRYCVNRHFGGTYRLHPQARRKKKKISERGTSAVKQYLHGAASQKTAFFSMYIIHGWSSAPLQKPPIVQVLKNAQELLAFY